MNLREAAQQSLEALEDSHQNINPERRYADELTRQIADAIAALRAALEPVTACHELSKEGDKLSPPFNHFADAGKMVDDTPEQKMLRKKWFGGRLYGHLPFLEAVDETMKRLYDKLDEANGTWKMLDNHFPDVSKMVATIRPEVTVEPVAWATVGFVTWGNRQIEKVDKLTREAQPEYGFVIPLYTAPPKHKPLTDEDIDALRQGEQRLNFVTLREFRVIARAIERAHGIGGEE